MTLTILHTADSHIGADLPARRRHARPRRGDDFVDRFWNVIRTGISSKVDLILHVGDVFNTPRPTANAVVAATQPLRDAADAGIPVIIVPGNHERSAIPGAVLLAHPNIHVIESPLTLHFERCGLSVAVSSFPCVRRGAAAAFDSALAATGWRDVVADVRILAAHQAFDSAVCGANDFRFRAGPDVIERTAVPDAFDLVACGHIHRYQKLSPAMRLRPHFIYCGSPDRITFAERNEPKGCVIHRFDAGGMSHEFREHLVRPMVIHPIAVNGLSHPRIVDALESVINELPRDAVAQIRLTGAAGPDALRGIGFTERAYRLRPDVIATATIRGVEPAVDVINPAGDTGGIDSSPEIFNDSTAAGRRVYAATVRNALALPNRCGVYAFFDSAGRLLYVGKAANLRSRIQSHLSASRSGNFFDGWVMQAERIEAVLAADDDAAVGLERELIVRWRPPFNMVGRIAGRRGTQD